MTSLVVTPFHIFSFHFKIHYTCYTFVVYHIYLLMHYLYCFYYIVIVLFYIYLYRCVPFSESNYFYVQRTLPIDDSD